MYTRKLNEHEIQKWCMPDLKVPEGEKGDFVIAQSKLSKGKDTTLISFRNAMLRGEEIRDISFEQDCHITRLLTKVGQGQLMSDSPQERYEVVPAIKACRGNVLVGGLGLGMYVQMLMKNPRVRHITVVELEPDIISLVAPSLPTGVRIIQQDLFSFLTTANWVWHNAIYDIWYPTSEGAFFSYVVPLRLASVKAGAKAPNIFCWAETEMIGQVYSGLSKASTMPDYWWPYNVFKRGLENFEKVEGMPIAERMKNFRFPNEFPKTEEGQLEAVLQDKERIEMSQRNLENPLFQAIARSFLMDIGSKTWNYHFGAAWDEAWSNRKK